MIGNRLYQVSSFFTPMFDENLACMIYTNFYHKNANPISTRQKMYISYTDDHVYFIFMHKIRPIITSIPRARYEIMKEKFNDPSKNKSILLIDICGLKMDDSPLAIIPDKAFDWKIVD